MGRPNIQTSHIVFDSHEENPLKESTRQSTAHFEMHVSKIERSTPIPKQMNRLWSSSQNKKHFQYFLRNEFSILAQKKHKEVVLSGMLVNGRHVSALYISPEGEISDIVELQCNMEEADQRLIKHIHWAGQSGFNSFAVDSQR